MYGLNEYASLDGINLEVAAKLDTGAKTASLSARDIKRCLKRAIAREVYRLMNTHAAAVARSLPMTA